MLLLVFLLFVGYCKYALAYKITVKYSREITADAERHVVVLIQKESVETILLFLILRETILSTLIRRKKIVNLSFKKRRK